jgi:CMP-N-acetylneuraminic acid synthetase
MIDDHSVLGVILARGGSKGLPRKNVRDLAGKPLLAWMIEAGHESERSSQIFCVMRLTG